MQIVWHRWGGRGWNSIKIDLEKDGTVLMWLSIGTSGELCEKGNPPSGSIKCECFLTGCRTDDFSKRTLFHGVSQSLSLVYFTLFN